MKCHQVAAALFIALLSTLAHADVALRSGQSVVVTCEGGGGGGSIPACSQSLTDWCNRNTSYNSTQCFQKVSTYCPSQAYSDCVTQTSDYCNRNTSMNSTQCFDSALGTCRGHLDQIRSLLEQVRVGSKLTEQGVDLKNLKADSEPSK